MDRHWTLDLVALSGIAAGFVLFTVSNAALLAGVVAAVSAYALVLPEFVASSRRASPR
ncbi:hypothetical protein ACFQMA_13970 [Halosimplex aquaticum]|uniref:Uncharacterized protein n=1 Tax=Halosimplex aquaticum TaxID=3026162 RepID=A0ABD5Y602_9EURY|nr:hypothetical protein [Halosimplex aquaticum]